MTHGLHVDTKGHIYWDFCALFQTHSAPGGVRVIYQTGDLVWNSTLFVICVCLVSHHWSALFSLLIMNSRERCINNVQGFWRWSVIHYIEFAGVHIIRGRPFLHHISLPLKMQMHSSHLHPSAPLVRASSCCGGPPPGLSLFLKDWLMTPTRFILGEITAQIIDLIWSN